MILAFEVLREMSSFHREFFFESSNIYIELFIMSRKNILSESCLNFLHSFCHSSWTLEKIGIHLSEHSVRWVSFISSMIIRSKGEDKPIFFLCFEDDNSPLRSSKSIELNTINALIDECFDIFLKSCYPTQFSPTKIGMSNRENTLTEWYHSLCDTGD